MTPVCICPIVEHSGFETVTGKSILIIEEHTNGHFLAYVSLLAKEATARGDKVTLALPKDAPKTLEYKQFILPLGNNIGLVSLEQRIGPKFVAALSQVFNADLTIVPNGDRFIMRLALHRAWRANSALSSLVMADPRWDVSGPLIHRLKMRLKLRLLKRVERMHNVQISWLQGPGARHTGAERVAMDPVIIDKMDDETTISKQLCNLNESRYWFGLVGVISQWKNLPLILDAFSGTDPNYAALLIAGKVSPDVRALTNGQLADLISRGFTIIVIDRLLSNQEMNQAVEFVDSIVLAYSTNAPPSTLGKAAALGTRIVAAGSESFISHIEALDVDALTSHLGAERLRDNMIVAMSSASPEPQADLGSSQFTHALLGIDSRKLDE